MRSDHNSYADLIELFEQGQHAADQGRVEVAGWFIGQQEKGSVDHRTRYGCALLLADGQARRRSGFLVQQGYFIERCPNAFTSLSLPEIGDF